MCRSHRQVIAGCCPTGFHSSTIPNLRTPHVPIPENYLRVLTAEAVKDTFSRPYSPASRTSYHTLPLTNLLTTNCQQQTEIQILRVHFYINEVAEVTECVSYEPSTRARTQVLSPNALGNAAQAFFFILTCQDLHHLSQLGQNQPGPPA